MRIRLSAAALTALGAAAAPASAAELNVGIEIPRLNVAEYHRPYVAIWIEKPDQSAVKTLAVWYEVNNAKNEGETWLKDLRQWWRRAGRSLNVKADGVSGATRAPGRHQAVFRGAKVGNLAPGQYALVVEAAREVGGREVVKVPFEWPAKGVRTGSAKGTSELGAVTLTVKP
jgi:hypothetical protein